MKQRRRRRGGRRRAGGPQPPPPPGGRFSLSRWLASLFARPRTAAPEPSITEQEARVLREFSKAYGLNFQRADLLKRALTHRSYLSVTGGMASESNERLEFLGDSVLGLVTSEHMFRTRPGEHEGQLTKTKSLLVSKAILSRRALAMGLGRFVLMSHSEIESGGRQRLSILADAFESVIGAIYLDLGFEAARAFIDRWLLRDAKEIVADKRHVNYKSHLQEYVQSAFRTHPVYRIRSEMGPDHSKHFMVEVVAGRRVLGEGRGRNKKEAEQAAARHALDRVTETRARDTPARETPAREGRERERHEPRDRAGRERFEASDREAQWGEGPPAESRPSEEPADVPAFVMDEEGTRRGRRRGRRGGRGRRRPEGGTQPETAARPAIGDETRGVSRAAGTVPEGGFPRAGAGRGTVREARVERPRELEPPPPVAAEDELEEVGRPEGPLGERLVDPFATEPGAHPGAEREGDRGSPAWPGAGRTPGEVAGGGIPAEMEPETRRDVPTPEGGTGSVSGDAQETGLEADDPGGAGRDDPWSYGRRPGRGRRNPSQT